MGRRKGEMETPLETATALEAAAAVVVQEVTVATAELAIRKACRYLAILSFYCSFTSKIIEGRGRNGNTTRNCNSSSSSSSSDS